MMTILKKQSQNLQSRAEAIIKGQVRQPLFSLATLLYGGSLLYGGAMTLRNTLYQRSYLSSRKLPCPVISVGNLTVGGTGKTPMALHLAQLISELGYGVAIVSRGYRSLSEKGGSIVSNGREILCDAAQAGDEPSLMASLLEGVPVVVGRNRYAASLTAIAKFEPDVIVLDDAFQHQRLTRDVNLVLMDAQAPFGNEFILPRGPLREPMTAIQRADAIILTRSQETPSAHYPNLADQIKPRPVFQSFHAPVMRCIIPTGQPLDTAALRQAQRPKKSNIESQLLFAFSGLAGNASFWETATSFGGALAGTMGFKDHHPYTPDDMETIVQKAQSLGSDCLVTTDKDFMRLPQKLELPMDVLVLGVTIEFKEDQNRWRQFIADRMAELTEKPAT